MIRFCAAAIACLIGSCVLNNSVRAADKVQIDSVSAHLFLVNSGTFSPDITTIPNFHSWNMEPSGDGIPDGEIFNAVLIKLRFSSGAETFAERRQGRVVVMSAKDRKVITSQTVRNIYVGPGRVAHSALLVQGIS